jgi:polyisoprenoid-binding protein YceI
VTDTPFDLPAKGAYRIDPDASEITFSAKHLFGLATVRGRLAIASGELTVDEDVLHSRVSVRAIAESFESGGGQRDRAVKGPKFLDVEHYPFLEFTSGEVANGNGQWTIVGTLTAHGVAAPLSLAVTGSRTDDAGLTIHATGRVDRYIHGVTATKGLTSRFVEIAVVVRGVPLHN